MKNIIFLILLLVSFTGCETQWHEDITTEGDLHFDVSEVSSRGVVSTTESIRDMSVFCTTTDDLQFGSAGSVNFPYFDNKEIKRVSATAPWLASGGVLKWKDYEYHSFFAFSPYVLNTGSSYSIENGAPVLNYVAADNKQKDLLYSSVVDARYYYVGRKPVSFSFKHALSKITFSSSLGPGQLTKNVKLVRVQFSDAWRKGTFSFSKTGDVMGGVWKTTSGANRDDLLIASVENGMLTGVQLTGFSEAVGQVSQMVDGQNLFALPQVFGTPSVDSGYVPDENAPLSPEAKMLVFFEISLPDGTTKFEKQEYILSATSKNFWRMGFGYAYNIVYNGNGTATGAVTVEEVTWDDVVVDANIDGLYLNLSGGYFVLGSNAPLKIYFDTNADKLEFSIDPKYLEFGTIDSTDALTLGYFTFTPKKNLKGKVDITFSHSSNESHKITRELVIDCRSMPIP